MTPRQNENNIFAIQIHTFAALPLNDERHQKQMMRTLRWVDIWRMPQHTPREHGLRSSKISLLSLKCRCCFSSPVGFSPPNEPSPPTRTYSRCLITERHIGVSRPFLDSGEQVLSEFIYYLPKMLPILTAILRKEASANRPNARIMRLVLSR